MPEPVGAMASTLRSAWAAGQVPAWTAVGAGNAAANQARVGSENAASGSMADILPPGTDTAPGAAGVGRFDGGASMGPCALRTSGSGWS